ncbi:MULTISPECIES: tRNA (N6-threonylcarbamoyladenosine(37)-N6)-methyltransferase TrmO [unclassified Halanaerobium]|uniref:tRNA (N6-threonylcarbamoyladenosine(37)-N6)-methyltransferase TrmO n=1 Tax=unclassified Halanaerobium TaxID=2641197 RepID=UPI000DF372A8|nr:MULTISPECIES: tRNA (N6-threonylcarbamoyladenosine(37)-N6)-methyltransferase TrmO [unclassified Halanaerobium]RCW50656.1 formylmethanofuran dehydrogenase subunit E [Halanaerobium sp. MA284_MarDTE_T2]RCW86824.1 formylmethanofuran dehydrogenase subunit E [Halanaerobium sp. DL-01]
MELIEIGYVKSKYKKPVGPDKMKKARSIIEVKEEYQQGLDKLDEYDYIQVLFYLHKSEGFDLVSRRRMGPKRGVFASRSPRRPNSIGMTTVEILKIEDNKIHVYGLDAIDMTPVIDIKPYTPFMDTPALSMQKENPRYEIDKMIKYKNMNELLLKAGELHGHFCPYLALGVVAAVDGVRKLDVTNDGMEKMLAVVETNSCFSDGIQYISGSTFGNNGLIYRDLGKTAVTFAKRNGGNIRYILKDEKDFIKDNYPEAKELFNKVITRRDGTDTEAERLKEVWKTIAFEIIEKEAENVFNIYQNIEIDIPEYAPIFEDQFCEKCGEKIMASKSVKNGGRILCRSCAGTEYFQVDGSGIVRKIE